MTDDYRIDLIYDQTGTTQRPGGQHAGSPATSVRITHIPTGLMAQCGARSQHKARTVAMAMLEYGLLELGEKR
jgi:protein subunit release factor A